MKNRIFVTGATGFIGANLVLKLARSGYIVHILFRSKQKLNDLDHPNIRFFKGDILDKTRVLKAMKSCDYVFHLAAYAKSTAESPETFYKVNVEGCINVLEAAKINKVKKVVVTSTAGILGPSNGSLVTEDSIRLNNFYNEYESSKFMMEERIQHYVRRGLDVVIVNPPRVYGPGLFSDSNAMTSIIKKYLKGKWHLIPGNGEMFGNYVYIDDVVKGHLLALKNGLPGEKYILGGVNASFNDFFRVLKNVSEKDHWLIHIPLAGMVLYAVLHAFMARILGKSPKITPKWVYKYHSNWKLSSQKAEKYLSYSFTPLKEGIRRTIDWIKEGENKDKPYTLVTGASSGIGKSLATKCAKSGMNLVLVALPKTGLPDIAEQFKKKYGIHVHCIEVDLTKKNAPRKIYDQCLKRKLNVNNLINNAGMGHLGAFIESGIAYTEKMMLLNMVSLVKLTRFFIPELLKQKSARILNVGSLASMFPIPYKSVYSATKAFVFSFSNSLREELKNSNVKVSCLCPGGTATSPSAVARIEKGGWLHKMFSMTADRLVSLTFNKFLNGRAVIIPGCYNRFIVLLSRLIPDALIPWINSKLFRSKTTKLKVS